MNKQQNTLRWLSRTAGRDKIYVGLLMLVQVLLGVSVVLYALLLRGLIDEAVAGSREGLLRNAGLLAALVLGQLALRAMSIRHGSGQLCDGQHLY